MSLTFQTCPACHTQHALMRNGEMSIHATPAGERCPGSGDPATQDKARQAAADARAAAKAERDRRMEERKLENRRRLAQDAHAEALKLDKRTGRIDRRIYGVRGSVRIIDGGLPELGKR